MPLQILFGKKYSGKTEHCFREMEHICRRQPERDVLYIVPEQYSYQAEKSVAARIGAVSPLAAEVVSFRRLYFHVMGKVGGAAEKRLTRAGKAVLLHRAAAQLKPELKALQKSIRYPGFLDRIGDLFSEFKRYGVSADKLADASAKLDGEDLLGRKVQEIGWLLDAFEVMVQGAFQNPEDEPAILARTLRARPDLFAGAAIFMDEFGGFTPQELDIILALAENCDVTVTLSGSGEGREEIFVSQQKAAGRLERRCKAAGVPFETREITRAARFEGFAELEALEETLLQHPIRPWNKKTGNVTLVSAAEPYGELEYISGEMIRLVRDEGLKWSDITIAARSLSRYDGILESVLGAAGIPFFLDKKIGAQDMPAAALLLAALDIFVCGWTYDSVFAYLKSGFVDLPQEDMDLLENYILATGIRGSSWTREQPWHYLPKAVCAGWEDAAFLDHINALRRQVAAPLVQFQTALKEAENVRGMCASVYQFMLDIGLDEKTRQFTERFRAEDLAMAEQFAQIWNVVCTSLDEIVAAAGDLQASVADFTQLLQAALSAHEIGIIPPLSDAVQIAEIGRSRVEAVDTLFLIGATDDVLPLVTQSEGLLDDRDRALLGQLGLELAPDTVAAAMEEDFLVYHALTAPKKRLTVSWPVADAAGAALYPARVVGRLRQTFPQLRQVSLEAAQEPGGMEGIQYPHAAFAHLCFARRRAADGEKVDPLYGDLNRWFHTQETWKDAAARLDAAANYRNRTARLDENLLHEMGKDDWFSISRMERFTGCPFAHYAGYLLGAQPRETAKLEVTDRGSFVHSVIEQIARWVDDTYGSWQKVEQERLEAELDRILRAETEQLVAGVDEPSQKMKWSLVRLREVARTSILAICYHLRAGQFVPLGHEIVFGKGKLPIEVDLGGKKVRLTGKIDRADIYEDARGKYIRIIDYKSYDKKFDISRFYYGLDLQLAVYLDSLCTQEGAEPAGMLYFRLCDPIVQTPPDASAQSVSDSVRRAFRMNGLVLWDQEIIKSMDSGMETKSDIIPVELKQDGTPSAKSSAASALQLQAMRKTLQRTLQTTLRDILGGAADVRPARYKNDNACTWCQYRDICRFDTTCGDAARILKPLDAADAWEEIMKGGDGNAVDGGAETSD